MPEGPEAPSDGLLPRQRTRKSEAALCATGDAGIAVMIGARIGALAGPSEIFASSTVRDLTSGSGLTFEDAGDHALEGVPDRWHLCRIAAS